VMPWRYWPLGVVQFLAYKVALSLFSRQTLNLISRSSCEQDSMHGDLAIRVKAVAAGPIIITITNVPKSPLLWSPQTVPSRLKSVQSRGGTDFISTLLLQIEGRACHPST
jgi:hypothetical protein